MCHKINLPSCFINSAAVLPQNKSTSCSPSCWTRLQFSHKSKRSTQVFRSAASVPHCKSFQLFGGSAAIAPFRLVRFWKTSGGRNQTNCEGHSRKAFSCLWKVINPINKTTANFVDRSCSHAPRKALIGHLSDIFIGTCRMALSKNLQINYGTVKGQRKILNTCEKTTEGVYM